MEHTLRNVKLSQKYKLGSAVLFALMEDMEGVQQNRNSWWNTGGAYRNMVLYSNHTVSSICMYSCLARSFRVLSCPPPSYLFYLHPGRNAGIPADFDVSHQAAPLRHGHGRHGLLGLAQPVVVAAVETGVVGVRARQQHPASGARADADSPRVAPPGRRPHAGPGPGPDTVRALGCGRSIDCESMYSLVIRRN